MPNSDLVVRLSGQDKLSPVIENVKEELNNIGKTSSKVESVQKQFDKITNSTAPLSKRIRDIKKEMENLAMSGESTSAEGQEMWKKLSDAAKQYDATLKKIQADTRSVGNESVEVGKGGIDLKGIGAGIADDLGLGGVSKSLGSLTAMVNPYTAAVAASAGVMVAAGKAAADFETHLDSLQSLTGLSDNAMKDISDGAVEMSKSFRASAADIVDAMKLIGSQAPELLTDKDALMEVTRAANVLAEAAQIDVVDAAKAITGTMNQMGVSASEATNIINTFAAASQQGSADVAYLNKAFEKSGTAASSAGMNYVQLAAAIESIAPKFSSADVAGSQLSSTLLKLSMSGKSDFMPSVVGMSQALENLANAEMNDAELKALVGESNITMIKSLIDARGEFDKYSQSLAGTNTAYDQMAINNDNMAGAINRLKSQWDAFLITLGQSSMMQGCVDNIVAIMDCLGDIVDAIEGVVKAFELFGVEVSADTNISIIQLRLLTKVFEGICEVLEVIVAMAAFVFNDMKQKALDAAKWIGDKWAELRKNLGDDSFVFVIVRAFQTVVDKAAQMIGAIKKYWNELRKFLGLKVEGNVSVKTEKLETKKTTQTNTETDTATKITQTKPKGSGSKTKTEKPIEIIDENSLKYAQNKVQELSAELSRLDISSAEFETTKKALAEWQKVVEERQKAVKIDVELNENSLKYAQDKVSELQKQLSEIDVNSVEFADTKELLKYWQEIVKERQKAAQTAVAETIVKIKPTIEQTDTEIKEQGDLNDKRQSYQNAQSNAQQVRADLELGLISTEQAKSQLDNIIAELQASFPDLTLDLKVNDNGTMTTTKEDLERLSGAVNGVGTAFMNIGNAMAEMGESETIAKAALIAQAIGQLALTFAESMKGTWSPWDWIAGATAGAAVLASTVAQLSSFASGGIVGGTSYVGDKTLIRANAGEMVLNKTQQGNLYNAIKSNNIGGGSLGGQVEFKIDGRQLKGVLSNTNNKISKMS